MKVSGFTFVRNAIDYDYPVKEAILSVLPLCDEFIVALGNSEDNTADLIKLLNSHKIKIVNTVWDDTLREGGKVLAIETNKALDNISPDSDWAFYIQADEVLHEKYHDIVREAMLKYKDNAIAEGLLFNYLHFYGSYAYVGDSRSWYRKEIRIIRNDKLIRSYKDAQGFRKSNKLLKVVPVDAYIYHYGWVKPPVVQQKKQKNFNRLWHNDSWIENNIHDVNEFDYSMIDSLRLFDGTHPEVMKDRINKQNWSFNYDISEKKYNFRKRVLHFIEKLTGWRAGEYKNYKLIK